MSTTTATLELGRHMHAWLFHRDPAQHPSTLSWVGIRVCSAFLVISFFVLFSHSWLGQGGQFLGIGMVHALPGIPEHEFWCVVVMGSLMRACFFALLALWWNQGVLRRLEARENNWNAFQASHGSDRFSQIAFAQAHGSKALSWLANGPETAFMLGSLFFVLPQISDGMGRVITNENFQRVFFVAILISFLLFVATFSVAALLCLGPKTIAWAYSKTMASARKWERDFDALPQHEKLSISSRAKTLGLAETTPALRREAVRSYNERARQAQEQSLAIEQSTPRARGHTSSRRL